MSWMITCRQLEVYSKASIKREEKGYRTSWEETASAEVMDNDEPGFLPLSDSEPACSIANTTVINLTEPALALRYEYNPIQSSLVTAVYPCICLFGLLANSAFLLAVYWVPSMRTITNIYLGNLAVSDITFLCTGTAFGLWKYLSTPVTADFSILGGPAGCFSTQVLNATPFYASTLLVTVVTVERYLAVCRPIHHLKINSRGRTLALVIATWLVASILAVLLFPSSRHYSVTCVVWPKDDHYANFPETIANCYSSETEPWTQGLAFFSQTVPPLLAVVINFILYFFIVRKLGKRIHKVPGEQTSGHARSRRTRDRVARMLVVTGIVFSLLLTPRVVLSLYFYIKLFTGAPGLSPDTEFYVFTATNVLLYVNSVINPLIYVFSNEQYRKAVWCALCPGLKAGAKCQTTRTKQISTSTPM